MIEGCRVPIRSRVADLALLREPGGRMVRIVRSLEIVQMAADAGRAGQVVVSIRVALRTCHADVRPGKREAGLGMIKSRRLPC